MRARAAFLVGLVVLGPACGHRGDPLPPRRRTPPTPGDFRLAQRGDALEVRATAPAASLDGVPYDTVAVEFLHVDGPSDLEKAGSRRTVTAVPGTLVTLTLPLPAPGSNVRAAARGLAGRERGQRTLTMELVTRVPLEAPRDLTATLAASGVSLSWRGPRPSEAAPPAPVRTPFGPATAAAPAVPSTPTRPTPAGPGGAATADETPATPRQAGFLVYRRIGAAGFGDPLGGEPLDRRTFDDPAAPTGATVCYVVRAVASLEPLIESAPSNEACIEVRDLAAPAGPAGLAVLPRAGGLELLWSPSAAPDLAGYRVYRTRPGGQPERIAEVAAERSSWIDEGAASDTPYRYTVTAFDRAGNESEPGEPVEGSLP
jgi:hypothetical protein